MRYLIGICALVYCAGFAQEMDEERLLSTAEELSAALPASVEEATAAIWQLCQVASQTKDSKIHWKARLVANKISDAQPFNPRARFAYGYFRTREALDTFEPLTQRQRWQDGRAILQDALMMGARDAHFLLDAGLLTMSLSPKLNLVPRGVDALARSRRLLGESFSELSASRRADWHAGMGKGFDILDLQEMARNHFTEAVTLAPSTASGEMARDWLKARNLG
jgi:hypothetical protein